MDEGREAVDFTYLHADIPAGMTIREWRAQRAAERQTRRRAALGLATIRYAVGSVRSHSRPRTGHGSIGGGLAA